MKIVLIGFRGSGKTTLGKLLAKKLDRPFVDTDHLVEKQANMPLSTIFSKEGEAGFRNREKEAVQSIHLPNAVVACGGGAILNPASARLLKQNGYCIWLTAKANTIWERVKNDSARPPLTTLPPFDEIQKLLETRSPIYKHYADQTFATDDASIQDSLEQVIKHLKAHLTHFSSIESEREGQDATIATKANSLELAEEQ